MNEFRRKHRLIPATDRSPLRVLAVGDLDHPDFATGMATLEAESELTRHSLSSPPPTAWDLLLVCQSRPGSLAPDLLIEWRDRNPLAGGLALLGSWCEGETRTGNPLPDFARLFWYHFPGWWASTREAWNKGRPTDWHWPFGRVTPQRECPVGAELVAVVSPDYSSASTLIDMCKVLGREAYWWARDTASPELSLPKAGIWIGGMLGKAEKESLHRTRRWLPPGAPLVVLLDFPRREDVASAKHLGATSVMGKPWRVDHLLAALQDNSCEVLVGGGEVA